MKQSKISTSDPISTPQRTWDVFSTVSLKLTVLLKALQKMEQQFNDIYSQLKYTERQSSKIKNQLQDPRLKMEHEQQMWKTHQLIKIAGKQLENNNDQQEKINDQLEQIGLQLKVPIFDAERRIKEAEITPDQQKFLMELKNQREKDNQYKDYDFEMFIKNLIHGKFTDLLKKRGLLSLRMASNGSLMLMGGLEKEPLSNVVIIGKEMALLVMAVDTITISEVDKFLQELSGGIKKYLSAYKVNFIYGGVAYLAVQENAHQYAESKGLLIVETVDKHNMIPVIVNDMDFIPTKF